MPHKAYFPLTIQDSLSFWILSERVAQLAKLMNNYFALCLLGLAQWFLGHGSANLIKTKAFSLYFSYQGKIQSEVMLPDGMQGILFCLQIRHRSRDLNVHKIPLLPMSFWVPKMYSVEMMVHWVQAPVTENGNEYTEPPRIIKFINLDLNFPIQAKDTHTHTDLRKKQNLQLSSPTAKMAQDKQKGISWKLKDLKPLLEVAETKGLN